MGTYLSTLYTLPLIFGAAFAFLLAIFIARSRPTPDSRALMLMILGASLWAFGYALEILAPDLQAKIFWAKFQYFGIILVPPAWVIFAFRHPGAPARLEELKKFRAAMWVIPALTLGLAWTNEAHHLVWREVELIAVGPLQILEIDHGPWFWVYIAFTYSAILLGSIVLGKGLLGPNRLQRWQILLALVGVLIPWIGNLVYLVNQGPLSHLDWTPFLFILAGLFFAISLFRFGLINLPSAAQQMVFDRLADCLLVLNMKNRIVDLNPAALKMTASSGKAPYGQPLAAVTPELAPHIAKAGYEKEYHVEITRGEGAQRRYYEVQITPLFGSNGRPIGRLVLCHEITGLKQEQARLEQVVADRTEELRQIVEQLKGELERRTMAEKQLVDIIQATPDAMLLIDQNAEIRLVNNQAERIFGYTSEELTGQNLVTLIPEQWREKHGSHIKMYFTRPSLRQVGFDIPLTARRKDGSEFPVEISLGPLNTAEGFWVSCNVHDISERKNAELALREQEQTYRALFECATDAILLSDPQGICLQVNQKAADLLGYAREEMVGTFPDIIAPGELPDSRTRLAEVIKGLPIPLYERSFRKKDGTIFPAEVNLSLVRDSEGNPRFVQSLMRDITERKNAEQKQRQYLEEIRQSRENLRALAARLETVREEERRQLATELHDQVGQTLTGLQLNLEIIRRQIPAETKPNILHRIEDSKELLNETTLLLRDVMADLRPPMLDDYGLLPALKWYGQHFSERTCIDVLVSGEESQPRLPEQVEIVLFRIAQEALTNIAKYAGVNRATISLDTSPRLARLSVADDGVGFHFEGTRAPKSKVHLGLLNMQERAASIGARLAIQTAPGEGTRITIEIDREGAGQ